MGSCFFLQFVVGLKNLKPKNKSFPYSIYSRVQILQRGKLLSRNDFFSSTSKNLCTFNTLMSYKLWNFGYETGSIKKIYYRIKCWCFAIKKAISYTQPMNVLHLFWKNWQENECTETCVSEHVSVYHKQKINQAMLILNTKWNPICPFFSYLHANLFIILIYDVWSETQLI